MSDKDKALKIIAEKLESYYSTKRTSAKIQESLETIHMILMEASDDKRLAQLLVRLGEVRERLG